MRGSWPGLAARHDRPLDGGLGIGAGDEALFGHPVQRVVTAPQRRVHVHERALPRVALQDAGDEGRLIDA